MSQSLLEIIQSLVLEGPIPAKRLAEDMGKPYNTLTREVNPDDTSAKFSVELLLPLMQRTGSKEPLEYLASRMDCRLACMGDARPDKASLIEELLDDLPYLAAYHQAMQDKQPVEQVNALLRRAIRELEEDFVAYRKDMSGRSPESSR